MTALKVSIAPTAGVAVPPGLGSFFLDAIYSRSLNTETSGNLTDLPSVVQDTVRAALDGQLHGSLALPDVAPSSNIDLCFLGNNGGVRLRKTVVSTETAVLAVELNKDEVATITANDPQPVPRNSRRAFFVPVTDQRVPFESSKLQIALIQLGNKGWTQLGLDQLFHSDLAITTSVQWNGSLPPGLVTQPWAPFSLAADGQFTFSFPVNSGDAWLWWLSGPLSALGVVIDDLAAARVVRIGVGLPGFSGPVPSVDGQRTPFDVTEAQVATHPNIYTEDPGAFCKPFSNPERVLGERSFFVILRAEQPVISAEATVHKVPLPVMTYAPSLSLTPAPASNGPVITGSTTAEATAAGAAGPVAPSSTGDDGARPAPGTLSDGTSEVIFVRHTIPTAYSDVLSRVDRGRTEMDAAHPMQWEDDSIRYQAVTVARGHILELRMRWRSNGYSLGTVAKTLTLAPRQVRRIEKVEWRRSEASRREETTRLFDQVSDTLSRDRTYEDAVRANLSEWESGHSDASMSSGAGGIGFAAAGFVIGGGGAGSTANSNSNQEGGRRTSASEEQRLRDTTRRYGDALRKLDSLVVNEVTQEESATGTIEIVRNPNYGHALTVIYYQILRHLKIETAVAGVRECLFVPFAISPFTLARTYRWRELIQAGMRDQQYRPAIRYLKDVLTNFASSNVPIGRRSDQPVRYIHGSLFLRLGIERPVDKDDGAFDQNAWMVVRPYLGAPALSIFQRLKAIDEAQRDIFFQQQHAGVIAASWVDTLLMDASGAPLHANFTLATRYQFNSTVRVDFSIQAPAGVTRETLANIRVRAGKDLPPGSVANLESMTFTYATDQFERTISASQGSDKLVEVETGVRRDTGITIGAIPDAWERTDVRTEMTRAVNDLLEHLNQHVEYYTKLIFWGMDRDRLWMMIDGFYVPGTNQVSIASVVERDPVAIIGNALVFRVSSGSFLGLGDIKTPTDLFNHYVSLESPSEPMLVSLPTDGLYAQTIMDECAALEEHFGNTDWVLNDPDPALGEIAPELLASRRAEPTNTTPTPLPQTLINLQNVPEAPAVSGLSGALSAVTDANAFRDMTGLAGTQANAASAFQTAANLATNFGNQAAALKLAQLAKDAHATQTADQKLATVQRALDKNLVTPDVAQQHTSQILDQLHGPSSTSPANQREAAVTQAVFAASASGKPFTVQHATTDGATLVSMASNATQSGGGGSGGSAPAQLLVTFIVINKFRETDPVQGITVTIKGTGTNLFASSNTNRVTVDMAGFADDGYDVEVMPQDVFTTGNFTDIGDPTTNPPNRLWESYTATITMQGNVFTSTDPRVSIQNLNITIRLRPMWMRIAAGTSRGGHVPSVIVIHHTDDENHATTYDPNFHSKINSSIDTWIGNGFAPHYVIDRDGWVVKLGHESLEAFHAGPSKWDGQTDVNAFSIGIEMVHTNNARPNGTLTYTEDYTQEQYTSLLELLDNLTQALNIPTYSVVGHSDVATGGNVPADVLGRKSTDPGIKFDWRILEAAGLGLQRDSAPIDFNSDPVYGGFFHEHPTGSIRTGEPDATPATITELKNDLTRIGYSITNNATYDDSVRFAMMVFCEHFLALNGQDRVSRDAAQAIKQVVRFLATVKP